MTLKQRHIASNKEINKLAATVLEGNHKKELTPMANKLGVTYQTIRNYCYGMGSDGYLKDAIIEELKKIK